MRPLLIAFAALALLTPSLAAGQSSPMAAKVQEVVARTKQVRSTFAVYNWTRYVPDDGAPAEFWGADFHSGVRHRMEAPHVRLVSDCDAGTGTVWVEGAGKQPADPAMAAGACGIDTGVPFVGGDWLGLVDTPFGKADRIRVLDADSIRIYDVAPDGVILATTFKKRIAGEPVSLEIHAVAVERTLPAGDLFSEDSLSRSVVPERYKSQPAKRP